MPSSFVTNTKGINGTLDSNNAWLEVQHVIQSFKGYEQQIVSTHCNTGGSIVGGWFTLSFDGSSTNNLRFDVPSSKLKEELEKLGTTGKLHVTCRDYFGIINAHKWDILFFISIRSCILCSNGSTQANVQMTERISGILPTTNSIYFNQSEFNEGDFGDEKEMKYVIGSLQVGIGYHVCVSA